MKTTFGIGFDQSSDGLIMDGTGNKEIRSFSLFDGVGVLADDSFRDRTIKEMRNANNDVQRTVVER